MPELVDESQILNTLDFEDNDLLKNYLARSRNMTLLANEGSRKVVVLPKETVYSEPENSIYDYVPRLKHHKGFWVATITEFINGSRSADFHRPEREPTHFIIGFDKERKHYSFHTIPLESSTAQVFVNLKEREIFDFGETAPKKIENEADRWFAWSSMHNYNSFWAIVTDPQLNLVLPKDNLVPLEKAIDGAHQGWKQSLLAYDPSLNSPLAYTPFNRSHLR